MRKLHTIFTTALFVLFIAPLGFAQLGTTISTSGKKILGPCGDELLLRGVNYAPYNWGNTVSELNIGEIAKTGANCVRMPWYKNNQNAAYQNFTLLDSAISKCVQNKLIPIIELHDQTCNNDPNALIQLANWYTQPAILQIINKYKHSLILNVANEALSVVWTSNAAAAQATFINTYTTIINNMRTAGIKVPIMIDGPDCGTSINALADMATSLRNNDPQQNLIFSAHAYWYGYNQMDSATVRGFVDNMLSKNVPFVLGEIANLQDDANPCVYNLNYKPLLNICQEKKVSWLAWSWDRDICSNRQITTNGQANSLTTFGQDILNNTYYGINTVRPAKSKYLQQGNCNSSGINDAKPNIKIGIHPNPAKDLINLNIEDFSGKEITLTITDVFGKIVNTNTLRISGNTLQQAIPSHLPNGVYFLKLNNNNEIGTAKFVLSR